MCMANDREILKVGWYNVGFHAPTMEGSTGVKKMQALVRDVREAFSEHGLHILGLCELGEHLVGLHKVLGWKGDSQEDIIKEMLVEVD